jgi:broad specificity phosphatase PhoE
LPTGSRLDPAPSKAALREVAQDISGDDMNLLLARHGESEWMVRGDEAGFNSPLTDRGRRQARLLGRWLAANPLGSSPSGRSQGIDVIYASPLIRARETAEIIAAELDLPLSLDDDLREFEARYWHDDDDYVPPCINGCVAAPASFAESYLPFRDRVQGAVCRILEAHPEGTVPALSEANVLVVAHGGTVGTIVRSLLGAHNFSVQTDATGLHSLRWNGSRWTIEFMNRLEHLLEENA